MIASWVMDEYGRKTGIVFCSIIGIFGSAGLCGARNIGMFITFRFFAGAGSWSFLSLGMLPDVLCIKLHPFPPLKQHV